MNNNKLHALRVKFPKAALELDLVSERVNPEYIILNSEENADNASKEV